MFTPKPVKEWRRAVAWTLRASGIRAGSARVEVVLTFYVDDERRRDADNLAKPVLDAATDAGVWLDDSQAVDTRIRIVRADPTGVRFELRPIA